FKLFLTNQGYDPTKPLTWSDLPAKPFAQVTDPPLTNGGDRIRAKLPADRSGHHVLYTIWQNSSTTDTYYSCSDVVFPAPGAASGAKHGPTSTPPAPSPSGPPASKSPTAPGSLAPGSPAPSDPATTVPGTPAAATAPRSDSAPSMPLLAGGAAAV